MSRALTICSEPGCANEVERGRCADCARARRAARPRGKYGGKWPAIRAMYLRRHPLCKRCGAVGVEVHHIDEQGPEGSNKDVNLETLCKSCHGKINLQPYRERDTMKAPSGGHVALRGPAADQPIVGGGLLDAMKRRI